MKTQTRITAFVFSAAIAGMAAISAVPLAGGSQSANPVPRAPRNAEEFDALFQQVKNWGRWGADDQLGAVNLVTAATRKRAVALATETA